MTKKPTIGITLGDPLGIGPEIIVKVLNSNEVYEYCTPKIIGDVESLEQAAQLVNENKKPSKLPTSKEAAQMTLLSLDEAFELATNKEIDALITCPVNKARLNSIDPSFEGHTDYFAKKANIPPEKVVMMFACPIANNKTIFVSLVTRHTPLKDIFKSINTKNITQVIDITHKFIGHSFKNPKIKLAILGLNPHAGEEGNIGKEEIEIILPAINEAKKQHIDIEGPFPADTAFTPSFLSRFDGWIATYHDQGLIPIKTLNFSETVNISIGLPFLRTSVAHGTAEDIAWKGIADEKNLLATIKLTAKILNANANKWRRHETN